MKAFFINRYKKKEPLQFGEMPEPTLGENDVLVGIHAASINQLDTNQSTPTAMAQSTNLLSSGSAVTCPKRR